eukprot:UN02459
MLNKLIISSSNCGLMEVSTTGNHRIDYEGSPGYEQIVDRTSSKGISLLVLQQTKTHMYMCFILSGSQ